MADTAAAIVLAGRRSDKTDPLAEAHDVSDKCLVPVHGKPLIEHVIATLSASPHIENIIVSVNEPAILHELPVCSDLIRSGRLVVIRSSANLAASIIDAVGLSKTPVLITTADNVLLSPQAIADMVTTAQAQGADAAAAFARKGDILAAHPDGQRRFYEFADDGYSNCNCYWLGSAKAMNAIEIFREGGQFAKNPGRIIKAFGLINLIRFRLGWGTLDQAFVRFSRRFGIRMCPVIFNDGRLAIDVDNERTHRVVSEIMGRTSKT